MVVAFGDVVVVVVGDGGDGSEGVDDVDKDCVVACAKGIFVDIVECNCCNGNGCATPGVGIKSGDGVRCDGEKSATATSAWREVVQLNRRVALMLTLDPALMLTNDGSNCKL